MNKKIYLILIIIIVIVSVAGYLFYNQNRSGPAYQACIESGGEVIQMNCCKSVDDFPNQCKIGACGCSPENSHKIQTCDCGSGKCFNGEECIEKTTQSEANFEEEGYLVKYGKEEKWALNYEEPGKPALVVTLDFDQESQCDLAKDEKPCLEFDSYGEVGDRIKVIGNKNNGVVEVDNLIYVK